MSVSPELIPITGLILAGGAGRRVGGQDKGLLQWREKPLVEQVAARLRPQVSTLLISCNRNSEYYANVADAIVADNRGDFQGPLAGLEAAIPLITTQFLIVCACDMPTLPSDLVSRLVASLQDTGTDISYAHDGERGQYLCAALRTGILPTLTEFLDKGDRAVRQWYGLHNSSAVDFSDQPQCFVNYNRLV